MACREDAHVVLLPIKPRYAEPIMEGRKRVEFRKTTFSARPSHVVVYASSPTQRIIGYFEVSGLEVGTVEELWERYAEVGCIEHEDFFNYYGSRQEGLALGVGTVTALDEPVALEDLGLGIRPPQSFMYLPRAVLGRLSPTPAIAPPDSTPRMR